jgi:hypothetical protein
MNQCIAAMDLLIELNVLEVIPKQGSISSIHLTEVVKWTLLVRSLLILEIGEASFSSYSEGSTK